MDKKKNLKIIILVCLVVLAFASKIFITIPNFSPIGAMILLGAAYFARTNVAILLPLALMWLVDLYLNNVIYADFFNSFQFLGQPGVYISLIVVVLIGRMMLKEINVFSVLGASLMASILFFLITNFNSWLSLPMYTKDFSGLISSYVAGIPFFRGTLFSNLIFTTVLFFAFEMFDLKYFTSAFRTKKVQNLG